MKVWGYIFSVIVGLTIGYFIFSKPPIFDVKTIYEDTGTYHISYIPKPYEVIKHHFHTDTIADTILVYQKIDTLKILSDYFKERKYKLDTSANDVNIALNYSVFMNRIKDFDLNFSNVRPVAVQITKFRYSAGVQIQGNNSSLDYFCVVGLSRGNFDYSGLYSPLSKKIGFQVKYNF